ncbi:MAG: hypothetical protein ACP5OA_04645 [Candidatus Woesearchaeota archaeon]
MGYITLTLDSIKGGKVIVKVVGGYYNNMLLPLEPKDFFTLLGVTQGDTSVKIKASDKILNDVVGIEKLKKCALSTGRVL